MKYGLGYLPSPKKQVGEKPDFDFEAVKQKLKAFTTPVSASQRSLILNNLDQGGLGACVANSGGQAIRASHVKQRLANGESLGHIIADPPPLLSRLMMYWLCRSFWHQLAEDSGTYVRTFFEMLNQFGFCPEALWTYDDDSGPNGKFRQMPRTLAFVAALGQSKKVAQAGGRPCVYHRITSTGYQRVEDVKLAIAHGFTPEFGTNVSNAFCNLAIDPTVPLDPPVRGEVAGGHAMIWTDYDSNGVGTLTPWGDAYDRGWFRMSWDYVADAQTDDIWVVDAAPLYEDA